MMGTDRLDVNDREQRALIEGNHRAVDHWDLGGDLRAIVCSWCGHDWPCPSIQALREYRDSQPPPRDPGIKGDPSA